MIDRGALVLAHAESQRYRGARRASLDGMSLRGSGSGALKARYREAVVAGEGVVEDLDEAIDMADHARRLGATVDVVVFEVPQGAAVTLSAVLRSEWSRASETSPCASATGWTAR